MKKNELVVSLGIAIALKGKDVPQNSLFYWSGILKDVDGNPVGVISEKMSLNGCCSAFTSSEVESMFPVGINTHKRCNGMNVEYVTGGRVSYYDAKRDCSASIIIDGVVANTEVDSRSLALLKLIDMGLVYDDESNKYKMPKK